MSLFLAAISGIVERAPLGCEHRPGAENRISESPPRAWSTNIGTSDDRRNRVLKSSNLWEFPSASPCWNRLTGRSHAKKSRVREGRPYFHVVPDACRNRAGDRRGNGIDAALCQ